MKEKEFYFSVVEEGIQNEEFIKKYPDYAGGRIEIWHKDEPYDVEEIRLLLPRKIFNKIRNALEMAEMDYFQIANVYSEEILDKLNKKKNS